jgi:hypothetical protein
MDVLGLQSSQINIQNQLLHNYFCFTVGGMEVLGRSGVVFNRGDPKGGGAYPPGGNPYGGSDACPPGRVPHSGGDE